MIDISTPRFSLFARAATASLALLLALGCGPSNQAQLESAPAAGPILLIGVDGMEWDVILPLLAEGRLPNLEDLMQRGVYGELETFQPTFSPVIWTTIATAKPKEEHGIESFAYDTESGETHLYRNTDRRTKAIWNIASDVGKRVLAVGWWMSYPVEEINGVMVAQTTTVGQLDIAGGKNIYKGALVRGIPGQVHPPDRQDEMMAILEEAQAGLPELTKAIFGEFPHTLTELDRRLWDNCLWAFRADATYCRIVQQLASQDEAFDLSLVYLGGPDVVGHRFWRYLHPELYEHAPTAKQIENLGEVVTDYYVYVDRQIGELLEAYPEETNVIIISDHGMEAINRDAEFNADDPPNDVNSGHHLEAPPGVFFAAGPCIKALGSGAEPRELKREDLTTIGGVTDITPTLLAMMRIPLGKDMHGETLGSIFRPEFRIELQPKKIATHDTEEFLNSRPTLELNDTALEERLEQLRKIGYLGKK